MGKRELPFRPNWATPPGSTLLDIIEERGLSQADLARDLGRPLKTINEIIKGKCAITPETALQLEEQKMGSADFWVKREALYRLSLARMKATSGVRDDG